MFQLQDELSIKLHMLLPLYIEYSDTEICSTKANK